MSDAVVCAIMMKQQYLHSSLICFRSGCARCEHRRSTDVIPAGSCPSPHLHQGSVRKMNPVWKGREQHIWRVRGDVRVGTGLQPAFYPLNLKQCWNFLSTVPLLEVLKLTFKSTFATIAHCPTFPVQNNSLPLGPGHPSPTVLLGPSAVRVSRCRHVDRSQATHGFSAKLSGRKHPE